jgi:hypothetical protein
MNLSCKVGLGLIIANQNVTKKNIQIGETVFEF